MKPYSQKQGALKRERERRGWTQEDLAAKIDAHPKTIGQWERGLARPDLYHIQKLIEVFGENLEELGIQIVQEPLPDHLYLDELSQEIWLDTLPGEHFYGRKKELAILERWIANEYKGIILVFGLGGIGKTALIAEFAKRNRSAFVSVLGYSLRTTPPFKKFVEACVHFFSPNQQISLPVEQEDQVTYLLARLQRQPSLLILDNFESILQSGDHSGRYREGYEGYGLLLEQIGRGTCKSCLLLTSREKPQEFSWLQVSGFSVRSLHLIGVMRTDGHKLLKSQGLDGSQALWDSLIQLYSGNPLALKLIAGYVKEIFGGDIEAFLEAEKIVFGNISNLLEQQFQRLSEQEREVIYWLAVEQQPTSFQTICEDIARPTSKSLLLEVLDSLQRRSLIEVGSGGRYSLQPVIAEYVQENLTKQIYYELNTEALTFFRSVALVQAQTQENCRHIQMRLILMPVLTMLKDRLGKQECEKKLKRILALLHTSQAKDYGYAASNVLHLLISMQADLQGLDCSSLFIQQAYLRGVDLSGVDFSLAHFRRCAFTDTFGCIYCVAFNNDGSLFAAGMTNGEVRLWQTSSLEPLFTFQGHTDGVRSIAFSANGKWLASGSHDQTVRIWNVRTGDCQSTLSGFQGSVRFIAFHPNGQMLASGGEDGLIRLYDVETGLCIRKLVGQTGWILTSAFSPDGSLLISGGEDGSIKVWDVNNGCCVDTLLAHTSRIRSLAYSPEGDRFASSSDDRSIKIWSAHDRQLLSTLEELVAHCTRSIVFSPDGKKLAAGGDDHCIYLWELATKRCSDILQGHTNRVWSVAFHPESQTLLSGSEDQTMRLWDSASGHCQHVLRGYSNLVWSVVFSPDNTLLSSGGQDSLCRMWDIATGHSLKTLRGHTNQVRCIVFSPDGAILASGSDDLTIRLWNVSTAQTISILHGHRHLVHSLAFHPDGTILASGSHDKSIRIWDVHTGLSLFSLSGQTGLVWSVAFNPDGSLIVSGSEDGNVRIWDMKTQLCLALLHGHTHRVWSVVFSPDGELIASAGDDRTIRLWRLRDGCCVAILEGHGHWVRTLAFSPDGNFLVSGSHDMTMRLWEIASGLCKTTFRGHHSWIWSVVFSSDGKLIASSSDDGTIKIWDRFSGKCLKTLRSERPYEGMDITGVQGLGEAQKKTLTALGAVVSGE